MQQAENIKSLSSSVWKTTRPWYLKATFHDLTQQAISATSQDAKGSTEAGEIWKVRTGKDLAELLVFLRKYGNTLLARLYMYMYLQKTVGNTPKR